jgi:BASS family bile acid:Na+ symporter
VTAGSYALAFGLPQAQKSVLSLGVCTRNLGAAFAPLFAVSGVDERAIVMVALGVPLQTIAAVVAARVFGAWAVDEASVGAETRP